MQTLNYTYKELHSCLCCNCSLIEILDLGSQPLANSYLINQDDKEQSFPLKLNYCKSCTHLQLSHAVNPDILFKNYLYVSGTTSTLKKYFDEFVNIVNNNILFKKEQLKVLDIACNDGSQLDSFKNAGHLTYGIDPAINLYETSSRNHNIICDYLTEESIAKFGEKFDVIIAQNVFAHNSYPRKFLQICGRYLEDDGSIFIQTSQADMIKYKQFDTIYHEHISFFNANSMKTLVATTNMYMNNIFKTNIHGNSYVFVISKQNYEINNNYFEDNITLDNVGVFAKGANNTIKNLENQINKFKQQHPKGLVIGYGAAAKGNTVLNYGKIKLDYIVDDNPLKQGLFTPGMKIPIVSLDFIKSLNHKNIAWIPLSWNFFEEIKDKISKLRIKKNDIFIKMDFANS